MGTASVCYATSAPATVNATPVSAETNLAWKIITCCTGPAGPVPATRVHAYYNNIYFFVAFKVAACTSYKYLWYIILCLMGLGVCIRVLCI